MSLDWFIALRFMWEQRTQNVMIVAGVGAGFGVLVFLTALIGGLQIALVDRTTGSQAHVVVTALEVEGRPLSADTAASTTAWLRTIERPQQRLVTLPEWRKLDRQIGALSGVSATVPTAEGFALALRGTTERAVAIIGADPDAFERVIRVRKNIASGRYDVSGADVVLGVALAKDLGIAVGDRLRIKGATGEGQLFIVRGLVDMRNLKLNKTWALMSLRNAQTLLGIGGAATSILVKVTALYEAEPIARRIGKLTGLTSRSWMESNAELLMALRSQSASTTMISVCVMLSIAIGIASVLGVSVIQRTKEIGILRAMGVTRSGILRIFLLQGGLIGVLGSGIGSILGTALSVSFEGMLRNPDGTPFFAFALTPELFAQAPVVALLSGVGAALVPARSAAWLDPAEAIRHG